MNQPDERLLKLLPCSSYLTMQQQDLPYNMQHASERDDIQISILKVISENSHADRLLSDLAKTINDLFAADACLVISTAFQKSLLSNIGYWSNEPSILSQETIQQLSILLSAHEVDLTVEKSNEFSSIENLLQILPNRTWIGIITQFQDRTNGLVLLLDRSNPWTDSQEKLLKQNSDLMAIAIHHTQLKQQAQTKTKYQTLLKNISREISRVYQPQLLYQKCLKEVCTALSIDRGAIVMLKYRNPLKAKGRKHQAVKGTVQIAAGWKIEDSFGSASSFSLDNSKLCQQAWRNAPEAIYFESDTPFPDLTSDKIVPSGSALLMMPLMGKKTSETDSAMILGFLVLQHDSVYHWSEDEIDLIDWVGVQISTAIVHHQTLNQVQSIVDEKTAQLTSSVNFQAKLSAKMRDHIKQLQQLNQLKDDFMNSMSHELKTPLTSMKMAIKMLRQTESPQMRDKYLDILEQEWNREYSLIKDLLALQQLESGEIAYSPQELNLTQTITSIARSFSEKWQAEDINLEIECDELKIYTDAESLEHILSELLSNAGKYSDPHTTIKLSAELQANLNCSEIVISIANVGAGISPEELPLIFDKFRRGKGVTDRAVPGTGLGLTLVQYFVEHLNGKIEVESEPIKGESASLTTFVLRLPQIQPSIS